MVLERPPGDILPHPRGPTHEYDEDFNDFFRAEYRRVLKFVMYAGAALEDAEDAASQAMAQAYNCWPLLTHPAAWARKVSLRLYLKKVMKDRRRGEAETAAARRDCLDRGWPESREEPDEHGRVIAVLRCLPPAQREVMALTFDGYTTAEIAEVLHQKPTTVRSNLRHARIRLLRGLQNPAADENAVGDEENES